jgi:hypothetical protein
MAIKLLTSYSKKLGLPGYSSHAFSASVEVELGDINQVNAECARMYGLLQASVDGEIRHTGFVPNETYGLNGIQNNTPHPTSNGSGTHHPNGNGNGNGNGANGSAPTSWSCSSKQRELIKKIATENGLTRDAVEGVAQDRFGVSLSLLNKLQASGLIDELLATYGGKRKGAEAAVARG